MAKAYKALDSYTDEGQFVMAMTVAGKPQKQSLPLKLTFVRPNKIDLDAGAVRLVSDGKTMTTAIIPLKRYTTVLRPREIERRDLPPGSRPGRSSSAGRPVHRCSCCSTC